jgi:hypothetical protein
MAPARVQRPVQGPRGVRARGHRLEPSAAAAVVNALRSFAGEETPLGCFSQLMAISLDEELSDSLHLLEMACGQYDVRTALQFRARSAMAIADAPAVSLWSSASESQWPKAFRRRVRSIFYSIDRTAGGQRSAAYTHGNAVPSSSCTTLALSRRVSATAGGLPPRVGRVTCSFEDTLPDGLPSEAELVTTTAHSIRVFSARRVPLTRTLADTIPASDCEVHMTDEQQRSQRARFRAVRMDRLLGDGTTSMAVFQPAKLSRVLQSCVGWRRGATGAVPPHASALRRAVWDEVGPTMLASSNHHPWDVRAGQPLTAVQCCAYFGLLAWRAALLVMAAAVTPCQFRSLLGQACHSSSVEYVIRRTLRRVDPSVRPRLKSFAALGAGVNTMGLVLVAVLGSAARYVWWAEACDIAQRAHVALWTHLGTRPVHHLRAEDPRLSTPRWRVDVELLSLRCAPFSPRSMQFPKGCAAALRELVAVLRGVAARRPAVIIYENTAGLWRTPLWRARVEFFLRYYCPDYEWESVLLSPHWHSNVPVRRPRVFYMAVLRSMARRGRAAVPSEPPALPSLPAPPSPPPVEPMVVADVPVRRQCSVM